jgi:hypothetical protein
MMTNLWDIVGQEVIKGLADRVTTVVNTAIPVLMDGAAFANE